MELSALQKMQQKQKEMEEENKRKKAALQETIKKRFVNNILRAKCIPYEDNFQSQGKI